MRILRFTFLAALVLSILFVAARGRWEGSLTLGNRTWIIDLERAPVWSPPAVPPYELFTRTFHDLPAASTPGLEIMRVFKWEWVLVEFALYLWGITLVFGLLYLSEPGRRRDAALHYALSVAAGLTGAAFICVALWLVFGGWGPPFPVFFSLLGITSGILIGRRVYRRKAA